MTELNDFVFSDRKDFARGMLDETTIPSTPDKLFESWLKEAIEHACPEPYAFTLLTNDEEGFPGGRVVYLRTLESDGSFIFFTNYNSDKAKALSLNNKVGANFFWSTLERQVRIKGVVEKLDSEASDLYFDTRPEESKLGAWASAQSEIIESRKQLIDQLEYYRKKFEGVPIPRPPFWGGYVIKPVYYEFWQGRSSRLHDRFKYVQQDGKWVSARLSP